MNLKVGDIAEFRCPLFSCSICPCIGKVTKIDNRYVYVDVCNSNSDFLAKEVFNLNVDYKVTLITNKVQIHEINLKLSNNS